MVKELIVKNRSYRRFCEDVLIETETLREFVDLARLCPSAANRQCIKYIIENKPDMTEKIFKTLAWAGYLSDWNGPQKGERPSAYIILLEDLTIGAVNLIDVGIAAQSVLLGAVEKGFGGCMLGSVNRSELAEILGIGDEYKISLVIALGKPKETVVLETVDETGSIRYWRDSDQVHHVPKRALDDIILG